MTLDQLRVFIAVAEHLHVTRAAQVLNMTQSAASASIAALESRCGVKLFDRVGRRIELTHSGQLFLAEARAVVARAAQADAVLAEISGLQRGQLSLYASQTIANYWLPGYLHRFRQRHPRIHLQLVIGNTSQVAQAVFAGAADLGFVEGEVEDPLLTRLAVPGDRLVLVVGANHPAAGRSELAVDDLARIDWVLRERGSGTRQVFETALRGYGLDPDQLRVALEMPSNEAVRSAVEAGAGATVISHLVAAPGLQAGTLTRFDLAFPERPFFVIRHRDRGRTKVEEALLGLIADEDHRQDD